MEMVLLMINHSYIYQKHKDEISPAFFTETDMAHEVFKIYLTQINNEEFHSDSFLALLPEKIADLVGKELFNEKYKIEPEKQFDDIFVYLRLEHIKEEKKSVLKEIKEAEKAGNWQKMKELLPEKDYLSKEEENLEKKRKHII